MSQYDGYRDEEYKQGSEDQDYDLESDAFDAQYSRQQYAPGSYPPNQGYDNTQLLDDYNADGVNILEVTVDRQDTPPEDTQDVDQHRSHDEEFEEDQQAPAPPAVPLEQQIEQQLAFNAQKQGVTQGDILKSKYSLLVMFALKYSEFKESRKIALENKKRGWTGTRQLEPYDDNELNLCNDLDILDTKDKNLAESLDANVGLLSFNPASDGTLQYPQSYYVNNLFNQFEYFLSDPKFQEQDKVIFNALSRFGDLRHHIYAMELHSVEQQIGDLSSAFYKELSLNTGEITPKIKKDLIQLVGKTQDAYVLAKKHHELNNRSKAQYFDDVMGGCLEEHLTSVRGKKSVELLETIINSVEAFKVGFDGTFGFSRELLDPCDELHTQTNGFSYTVDYKNGNELAKLYEQTELKKEGRYPLKTDADNLEEKCYLKDLPRLKRDYDAWQELNSDFTYVISSLEEKIDADAKQLEESEDTDLYTNYLNLIAWRKAVDTIKTYYRNDDVLLSFLQNAGQKIDEGVVKVVKRVQKLTSNITKNLKALHRVSGSDGISNHIDSYSQKLERLRTMQIQDIVALEPSVGLALNAGFKEFYDHLQKLINDHNDKLRQLHQRLESGKAVHVQNPNPAELEKLLNETKEEFETERGFLDAIFKLCKVFGYQDNLTQDDPEKAVADIRINIEHTIHEQRHEVAKQDLNKVVQELLTQVNTHTVNVEAFGKAFNTLHVRITELLKFQSGKSAEEQMQEFVAGIEQYFYIDAVASPGEYPLTMHQFTSVQNLVAGLKASEYAELPYIKGKIEEFEAAKKGLEEKIEQLGKRVSERNEKIKTCTAEDFLGLVQEAASELQDCWAQFDEEGYLAKSGHFIFNRDSFTNEVMKKELAAMNETEGLLVSRKAELEKQVEEQFVQKADEIIASLEKSVTGEAIEIEKIDQGFANLDAIDAQATNARLNAPQQVRAEKTDLMKAKIGEIIAVRVAKFAELTGESERGLTKDMSEKYTRFIEDEEVYSGELQKLCEFAQFNIGQEFQDDYLGEFESFKQNFELRKVELEFAQIIDVLNDYVSNVNLQNLTDEQVSKLDDTFEMLKQRIAVAPTLSEDAKDRIGVLLHSIHCPLGSKYHENAGYLEAVLGLANETFEKVMEAKSTWEKQSKYQVELNDKLVALYDTFKPKDPAKYLIYEVKKLTIDEFIAERKVDAVVARRNLIAVEKYTKLNEILSQANAVEGRRATGINALKRLKSRWDKVPANKKASSLDVYFTDAMKIINTRLAKNPTNAHQDRNELTHDLYVKSKADLVKLVNDQLELIVGQIVADQKESATNGKQIISRLQTAQKMMKNLPIADRVKFYDGLYDKLNELDPAQAEKTKQMVLVLRASEAAHDSARKKHAKLGRATGVGRIVRAYSRPEQLLKRMQAKLDNSSWLSKLIDKLLKIVEQRLKVPNRDEPKRHAETQKFYDKTKSMYELMSKQLGGTGSDPSPTVKDDNHSDDAESVADDVTEELSSVDPTAGSGLSKDQAGKQKIQQPVDPAPEEERKEILTF